MTELRLAMLGLGNVAQAFLNLLPQKLTVINQFNTSVKIVGVATASHGLALNQDGIAPARLLETAQAGQTVEKFHTSHRLRNTSEFVEKVEADVLLECTPLNPTDGQPAIDYITTALQRQLHVITANKSGPAFAFHPLTQLARKRFRAFLYEGTVMDGAPVFSLVRDALPATQVKGFRGIVNSTTNFILTAMEEGLPLEDAIRRVQALGIAERNVELDLDGWDAAAKTAILANALLGGDITPAQVSRTGIKQLTTRTVIEAARQGLRFKLLAEAWQREEQIIARVTPRMLPLSNPLAHVNGTSAALTLFTDTLGELTIHLNEGETQQTAYALLADLMTVIKTYYYVA